MAAHRSKDQAALVSVHDLLDATQRTALVAALRARQAEHENRMENGKEPDGPHAGWQQKHVDELTAKVGLDASQQAKVLALLAQDAPSPRGAGWESHRQERKQRGEALLTAFAGDTFGGPQVEQAVPAGDDGREPTAHHGDAWVAKILPVLRPDQREKLAASMESEHRGPGGAEEP
jgi:hypothetical protein